MSLIKRLHISDEKYGNGAYGSVYKCVDDQGIVRAVKQIPIGKDGIPSLLEATIMVTIDHPNIASAIRVYSSSSRLSIIQDPATTDLYKYVKHNGPPPEDRLKIWLYSLASAVACLHNERIIHGDLKSNNCLLFPDDQVKLTDFSLSVKVWDNDMSFHHPVCTGTHRPPENYDKKPWSYPLDIWSLGCTFYELATGRTFLPEQGTKDQREHWIRGSRALRDWGFKHPFSSDGRENPEIETFIPVNFKLDEFVSNEQLKHLILCMLQVDQESRPTAKEVLDHPYFGDISSRQSYRINSISSQLESREQRKFSKVISSTGLLLDRLVFDIALNIYSKSLHEREINDRLKILTCVWMASKLVWLKPIDLSRIYKPNEIFPAERIICESTGYRLL